MHTPSSSPIIVEVPARPEHVQVIRGVVASLAARLDMPFDAIEDLKIAVNEACAQLLESTSGATLRFICTVRSDELEIAAAVDDPDVEWPPQGFESSMTWHILTALTDDASFERDGGTVLRFTKRTLERSDG